MDHLYLLNADYWKYYQLEKCILPLRSNNAVTVKGLFFFAIFFH